MSYDEAMAQLSRDERFKATVYAMNTLLIDKGIYTKQEFRQLFIEWATKEKAKDNSSSQPSRSVEAYK